MILIALPVYNEENTLKGVLDNIVKYPYDVLVVDDGSSDNSLSIAQLFDIQIIHHSRNLGVSSVSKSILEFAAKNHYSHVITLDSDGQHNPTYIPQFAELLNDNIFVAGNRFSNRTGIPKEKISSNLFASVLVEAVTGTFVEDVSCGFRSYSVEFACSITASADNYDIVYQMMFHFLQKHSSVSTVKMSAKYTGQPMITRTTELLSLLSQTHNYSNDVTFSQLINKIENNESANINLLGMKFDFQPVKNSAYIISTDIQKAESYYTSKSCK